MAKADPFFNSLVFELFSSFRIYGLCMCAWLTAWFLVIITKCANSVSCSKEQFGCVFVCNQLKANTLILSVVSLTYLLQKHLKELNFSYFDTFFFPLTKKLPSINLNIQSVFEVLKTFK